LATPRPNFNEEPFNQQLLSFTSQLPSIDHQPRPADVQNATFSLHSTAQGLDDPFGGCLRKEEVKSDCLKTCYVG
jgi:hypothetical protein